DDLVGAFFRLGVGDCDVGAEFGRERIERGIADGDVPAGADAATVAAFYNAVNHGMAIQARDGANQSTLSAVAEAAIAAWDGLVGG
ncbi:MAG TPA: hypothetical protein VE666_04515, partial [Mycobacterium sp.]|nr:hypothetical protein [Mycobacterium sp.]